MYTKKIVFLFLFAIYFLGFFHSVFAYTASVDTQFPATISGNIITIDHSACSFIDSFTGLPSSNPSFNYYRETADTLQTSVVVSGGWNSSNWGSYSPAGQNSGGTSCAGFANGQFDISFGGYNTTGDGFIFFWATAAQPPATFYRDPIGYIKFHYNSTGGSFVYNPTPAPTLSSQKSITTFNLNGLTPSVVGSIDETNHSISLTVPFGTDVTALVPTIAISDKATINPGNNIVQDFTNPVVYTVTAEDGSTQSYTVTVTHSCIRDCFSNVLFIPGLEASRLYTQRTSGSEDQLWEPNGNSDVEDLYLDTDGASKNQNIYTRDIIKESNTPVSAGFLGQNIYKIFTDTLDQLVNDFKIADWKYYAYDWRQGVDDIVNNGTKYQEGNISLADTLQSLVKSSKNGKVTIVAHSNGGLIAKALLKKLQDDKIAGRNNLIDSVETLILVAVPEIGTASAVPALMHGYNQSMAGGWLLDEMHARELGRNMPGAFGLLPSKEYLNRVSASPVTFMDTLIPSGATTKFVQTFGSAIDSYEEYKSFLFGEEGRTEPLISETNLPISLSQNLFTKSESLHNNVDMFTPPSSIRLIEVAGWGTDTVASFEYYPLPCSQSLNCGFTLDERPRFTANGDGTVVVPSAQYMSINGVEKYWVDLSKINRKHKDILEVVSLDNLVLSVIEKKNISLDTVLKNSEPTDFTNRLRLSVHSPVTINAYDANGNHTGKTCSLASDFCFVEENILNSSYMEFGEGKYLNLPEDQMAEVTLQGTDIGTFTYDSERVLPDGMSTLSSFIDIPVTTQTEGKVTLDQTGKPQLVLDVTGDGRTDITLAPSLTFDAITYLKVMRATINSLDLPQAKIKTLDNRIDNITKSIEKGKIDKAKLTAEKFKSTLEKKLSKSDPKHSKPKKLSKTDAQLLLDMLNKLLDNLSK
jgi:hypothetical protein